jgi:hypothetical protein
VGVRGCRGQREEEKGFPSPWGAAFIAEGKLVGWRRDLHVGDRQPSVSQSGGKTGVLRAREFPRPQVADMWGRGQV